MLPSSLSAKGYMRIQSQPATLRGVEPGMLLAADDGDEQVIFADDDLKPGADVS